MLKIFNINMNACIIKYIHIINLLIRYSTIFCNYELSNFPNVPYQGYTSNIVYIIHCVQFSII